MAKKKVTVLAEELLGGFLEKEGYELYSSEFVKEGKDWFLRIYIDKPEGEGYIGTEDCEKVSRFLSEKLDGQRTDKAGTLSQIYGASSGSKTL